MKLKQFLLLLCSSLLVIACQSTTNSNNQVVADQSRIKAHLKFLADDLMEGRDTGSRGHEIASLYIASQFAQYGLKPAGENGTYMQRVPFRQAVLDQKSPQMILTNAKGTIEFSYPKQYITAASTISETSNLQGEMVFAGYGIIAPELGHNDYAGLDVKGKIVVVLSGKPQSFPSEEGAHFSSRSEKNRYAAENGAIGMIGISTPIAEKVRPFERLLHYLHMPMVSWLDEQGKPANTFPELKNSAYMSKEAAAMLFEGAQVSLEQIYAQLEQDKSPKGFDLPGSISFSKKSTHKAISSPNVAAILEGSDPTLKDEYVVFSAHSDHIGFAKTVEKDKINNGAMDNASGTSVLIETARLFSQMPVKPKRSILFVAVTAEEKGLLGADYFARHPTVPQSAMVANVNLDMPILTYEFADIIAFGANHSDMQQAVEKAASNIGLTFAQDPWPEQALFTRSDHYSFVKQGVPAVFLVPGLKSVDPNVDGSKQFGRFLSTDYHKPSDEFNDNFNWKAAQKFAEVNFQIGVTLADQQARPQWNKGDFFGNTFGK